MHKHLVLLPGLDGSGILFKPILEYCFESKMSHDVSVISYPIDRHIPYSKLADYIIPLLPKNTDIVLLGESYSGPVAIQLANRKELNIVSLLLVATFSYYPNSILKYTSYIAPYHYLLRLPAPDIVLRFMCVGNNVDVEIMALLKRSLKYTPAHIMSQRLAEGIRVDVRVELKSLPIPCIYLKAKQDKLVPASAATEISILNESIDIIEIDGPHFLLQTRIKECCAVIQKLMY